MNLSTSLGLYAVINRELGKPLLFPGSEIFYTKFDVYTSSKLHAGKVGLFFFRRPPIAPFDRSSISFDLLVDFNLWAALEPRASNEAFNVVNGDVESWQNMWPKLARRFDCRIPEDMFSLPASDASSTKLAERPPLANVAAERGLAGRVNQGVVEQRIDLVRWSQKDEVKQAWASLADREGLERDAFDHATWDFLGFVLGRSYDVVLSMSKARKLGWSGYADTWDAFDQTFSELERARILP